MNIDYAQGYDAWLRQYGRETWIADRASRPSLQPLVSEALLRCVWFDQLFIPSLLQTENGDPVVVEHPGVWNTAPGPDFLNARIRIGHVLRTGDVEIHLTTRGWRLHGHHLDSAYNRVILHVTLWQQAGGAPPATNSAGRQVPEVILEPALVKPLEDLLLDIDLEHYPDKAPASGGRCQSHAGGPQQDRLIAWVIKAGDARFETKIRRALFWLDAVPKGQEAWAWSLIENFGFGGHRRAYRHAAETCRVAGWDHFFGPDGGPDRPRIIATLRRALEDQVPDRPIHATRPHASHSRRIHLLAGVLNRMAEPEHWRAYSEQVDAVLRRTEPDRALRSLRAAFDSAMRTDSGKGPNDTARVGSQIRDILSLNFHLPFLAAHGRAEGSRSGQDTLYACYRATRRLPENRIEKQGLRALFGLSKKNPAESPALKEAGKTARFQQGIHRLYEDFCALGSEGCERCPIPASLEMTT